MLVDVRDAELTSDPETLVNFIELAILPVAAGLEGLRSERNRVKIVFPTVGQLLQYRRRMALAAPEVVALSTLGFGPVERRDNLVVIVAPGPDDEEGLAAMNRLLDPSDGRSSYSELLEVKDREKGEGISQPVVVLNPHMVPVSGPAASFDVAYHLRLLSVQYMTGDMTPDYLKFLQDERRERRRKREGGEEEAGAQAGSNEEDDEVKQGEGRDDDDDDFDSFGEEESL